MSPRQWNSSLWQNIRFPEFPPLTQNASTDVAIVGAGISGLTTAYILLQNGFKVTVLDKSPLGQGETARTSAHLSSILDEGFHKLIHLHGPLGASRAYASHSDAIDLVEKILEEESIDCDFARIDGYVYLSPETNKDYLRKEYEASLRVGVAQVEMQSSPFYFPHLGPALCYGRQARFHPLKYLRGLAEAIIRRGGIIHTGSRVVEFFDRDYPYVRTSGGQTLHARQVVICTNVPVNDRFRIHNKEAPYRSYLIGLEINEHLFPDIFLWDTSQPYHYVRKVTSNKRGKAILLVGGEDHRVGQDEHSTGKFSKLQRWCEERLALRGPLVYQWSGQIIEPPDGLAYIGRNPGDKNTFISCGDSGHGLTHAGITAMLLRDLIQGHTNEWAELYSPQRLNLKASKELAKELSSTLRQYTDRIHVPKEWRHEFLQAGEGTLLEKNGEIFAIYRDEKRRLYCFKALCPHLGGVVHWNATEKSWDCPCHGSRFACTGEILNGPALSPLTPAPLPGESHPQRPPQAPDLRLE